MRIKWLPPPHQSHPKTLILCEYCQQDNMFPDVNILKHMMEKINNRWQEKFGTHKKRKIRGKIENSNKYGKH